MHVHIHTTIVSPSNQLRFKTLVKVDVNPADNLRQVLSQHDKSKKEDKYKILQYWDARNMTDPSNRVRSNSSFHSKEMHDLSELS